MPETQSKGSFDPLLGARELSSPITSLESVSAHVGEYCGATAVLAVQNKSLVVSRIFLTER